METPFDVAYPKIPGPLEAGRGPCVVFEKLDGTNLGWAWRRGFGFGPATTRRGLAVRRQDPELGEALPAFKRLRAALDRALARKTRAGRAKVFFEYLGPSSFAGVHVAGEPKRLVLLDVALDGEGFLGPEELLEAFEGVAPLPRVVHRGAFTGDVTLRARRGDYGVAEGVVVKGGRTGAVWMVKVKTDAWTARLERSFAAGRWRASDGIERLVTDDAS